MTEERRADRGRDPLARVILRSRVAMGLELFTRAVWPLGSARRLVGGAGVRTGRDHLADAASGAGCLAGMLLVWRCLCGAQLPLAERGRGAGADRRDAAGAPLAALRDTPALGLDDPGTQAVWAAHLARMRRLAASAVPARADLRLAGRDPWALRLMALVLLIAAAVFARDPGIGSVAAALQPAPGSTVATGPSFEGWAEPPAYTGRPRSI